MRLFVLLLLASGAAVLASSNTEPGSTSAAPRELRASPPKLIFTFESIRSVIRDGIEYIFHDAVCYIQGPGQASGGTSYYLLALFTQRFVDSGLVECPEYNSGVGDPTAVDRAGAWHLGPGDPDPSSPRQPGSPAPMPHSRGIPSRRQAAS